MPASVAFQWWLSLHAPCPWGLPWPWFHALRGCLALGSMPIGDALSFSASTGLSWLLAYGGYLGLGNMPIGATLALAVCLSLGCCMPWPWLPCPQILNGFPKNEGFCLENEVIFPKEVGIRHGKVPKGMPACTPCRIVSDFGKISSYLFPFLCS